MTITNYKLKDFLVLDDADLINQYLPILQSLSPAETVQDPIFPDSNIRIKHVRELLFGEVNEIRMLFDEGTISSIIEAVAILTNMPVDTVNCFTIVDFYSIYNCIEFNIEQLSNMEENELVTDNSDPHWEMVRAGERMARFGILNQVNSLAGGDITKWESIMNMPYMTVFTKLRMDKEQAQIQNDLDALRKNKLQ